MKQNNSILLFLVGLLTCYQAFATDYYIDPVNGGDGNNGLSSDSAFKSLHQIDNLNLKPGDIVYFMGGTYQRPGQTLLTINESGTEDNYITFTNYNDEIPILEFDSWTGIDIIGGSSYLKFDGLHIKGAREKINLEDALNQGGSCANDFTGNVSGFYNGTGILAVGPNLTWSNPATTTVPHHITVENCEVYDCSSSGMAFQQADYITVKNNKVYNNCWYTIYGTSGINLYQLVNVDGINNFHNEIVGNLIYGNRLLVPQVSLELCEFLDGNGIIVDDLKHTQRENYKDPNIRYGQYFGKTLIANNIAVENGGSGLHFFLSNRCHIYNNTVANNAFQNDGENGNAELRIGLCTDFFVKNNILKGDYTVHHLEATERLDYSHNYQFGPDILESLDNTENPSNCEGCIGDSDIEFLNTDVNHPTPYLTNFSAITTDKGVALEEIQVEFDYLGNSRPYANGYDIGAYEVLDCELLTWYADSDNDGIGNENESLTSCEQPEGYVATSGDLCSTDPNKIAPGECGCEVEEGDCEEVCEAPITWYADKDNDGFGDANDIILDCDQPEGYVNNSLDLCPNDNIKSEPGNCGCGVNEDSCGNPEELCDSAEYDSSFVYDTAGTTVLFDGSVYQNMWYTSGQLPTSGGPWELIQNCNGGLIDCSNLDTWSSASVYSFAGIQVEYNQSIYENKWYITGDRPDSSNAWKLIGFCEPILSINNIDPLLVTSNNITSNFEISVYNIDGSLAFSTTSTSNNINDIDLSHLDSDIYIISFTDTNTGLTSTEKIIR